MFLAVLANNTILRVILEERVGTRAVAPDALATVSDANGPCSLGLAHIRIKELVILSEGNGSSGIWLVVGSLGLDGAVEDVLCTGELVLRHLRVLRGGSVHPDWTLGFNKHTATIVDVDLSVVVLVELVIGSPEPDVFEVAVRVLGNVQLHEGTNALWVGLMLGIGVFLTVGGLELGTGVATDTEVNIPETGCTILSVDVPLHQDTTGSGTLGTDNEIRGLKSTLVAALGTNLETRLGVVHVREELASDEESAVDFTNNLDVLLGRDGNGLGDEVGTVVDMEDLAFLKAINSRLESGSIIGHTVTLGTLGLEADKLGDIHIFILGPAALEPTILALKALRLCRRTADIALNTTLGRPSSKSVTLSPGVDLAATFKDGVASSTNNSLLGPTEVDIVQDEGTTSSGDAVLSERGVDANGSIGELAVKQENGTNSLVGRAVGHVETDLAVVDEDALVGEDPVPVLEDRGTAVIESHVADSELLGTHESTNGTTVEGQVGHETTRAVVLEDALLVLASVALGHLENNVLQTGGLRNLPVDTSGGLCSRDVDNKVTDLTVEVVLVGVPVGSIATWDIGVGIDQAHTFEVGSGLQDRHVQWVTDELGVVVLNDGLADDVGTGREVDESGGSGCGVAALTTTVAVSDNLVNDFGIVSNTIALGSQLLDVTEDLVGLWVGVESSLALTLDTLHPETRTTSRWCWCWCWDSWCLSNRDGRRWSCGKENAQRQEKRSSAESHHDDSA